MNLESLGSLLFTGGTILVAVGFAAHLGHAVLLANGRRALVAVTGPVPAFAGVASGSFVTARQERREAALPAGASSSLAGAALSITIGGWVALALALGMSSAAQNRSSDGETVSALKGGETAPSIMRRR